MLLQEGKQFQSWEAAEQRGCISQPGLDVPLHFCPLVHIWIWPTSLQAMDFFFSDAYKYHVAQLFSGSRGCQHQVFCTKPCCWKTGGRKSQQQCTCARGTRALPLSALGDRHKRPCWCYTTASSHPLLSPAGAPTAGG